MSWSTSLSTELTLLMAGTVWGRLLRNTCIEIHCKVGRMEAEGKGEGEL